jgi:hypothetical protein
VAVNLVIGSNCASPTTAGDQAMDNFPPSTYSQGAAQYSAAPGSSLAYPSFAENDVPAESAATGDIHYVPRPKRIACIVCRRRKLRCDGTRPSCGTCSRLGHECAYDEVRKKSGPKRGYVKQLEARLGTNSLALVTATGRVTGPRKYVADYRCCTSSSRNSS